MWRFILFFSCILCISCQSTVRYRAVKDGTHDSKRLEQFIAEWMGTPYQYGGMNKNGVDCSGFVSILMKEIYGIRLPHASRDQYKQGRKIARNRLREGDLVFFNIVPKRGVDHVGFFLGGDKFVHASTESGVTVSNLGNEYYRKHYYGACRYFK
jgi:cell wall-associated NlpC family hydrolase